MVSGLSKFVDVLVLLVIGGCFLQLDVIFGGWGWLAVLGVFCGVSAGVGVGFCGVFVVFGNGMFSDCLKLFTMCLIIV